jgi:hypothetical protein
VSSKLSLATSDCGPVLEQFNIANESNAIPRVLPTFAIILNPDSG